MLVLSYAVKGVQGGSFAQRFTPHLAYQTAKIFSYMAVGLALGAIGAAFDISGIRGWVMVAAGAFMVLLGLNMTGRVPWLKRLTLKPPAFLIKALAATRRKANEQVAAEGHVSIATPLTFGLLTGLMPCGPLQAAQLAAAGAGSPIQGATVMLGFGLGTAPLMLAFGTASGFLTSKFKDRMMVAAAVIIIVLGLVMLNRGAMMLGSPLTAQSIQQSVTGGSTTDAGDFQTGADGVVEVPLTIANVKYAPNVVVVPADQPVRLIVDRQEDNVCSDELWIPQLGIAQPLEPFGTTIVEIPASAAGNYSMTCQMGMMSGTLQIGVAGGGGGGTLLPLLGALIIIVLLIALWRTQPKKASYRVGGSAGTKTGKQAPPAPTILGLTPQEVLIVTAFIAAAIIAGLTLGGMLGT
jgi:sulfite exporter TauE/SafE